MFREILQGLSVTFRHLFRKKVTVQYPEQREKTFPRTHGRHFLRRHPDGLERCVGCTLCAGACPANAIFVQAGENTPEHRVSPGERYAAVYKINMIRCMDCGYCVQACPYGVRYFNEDKGIADKCNWCYHRITKGLNPACVEVCPVGARIFGDQNDKQSPVSLFIRNNRVEVLRPDTGNKPNTFYVGIDKEVN